MEAARIQNLERFVGRLSLSGFAGSAAYFTMALIDDHREMMWRIFAAAIASVALVKAAKAKDLVGVHAAPVQGGAPAVGGDSHESLVRALDKNSATKHTTENERVVGLLDLALNRVCESRGDVPLPLVSVPSAEFVAQFGDAAVRCASLFNKAAQLRS